MSLFFFPCFCLVTSLPPSLSQSSFILPLPPINFFFSQSHFSPSPPKSHHFLLFLLFLRLHPAPYSPPPFLAFLFPLLLLLPFVSSFLVSSKFLHSFNFVFHLPPPPTTTPSPLLPPPSLCFFLFLFFFFQPFLFLYFFYFTFLFIHRIFLLIFFFISSTFFSFPLLFFLSSIFLFFFSSLFFLISSFFYLFFLFSLFLYIFLLHV